MFPRVCHGCGTADENGVLSVEAADSFETPKHIGHVTAKNTPVDVEFVHDHIL